MTSTRIKICGITDLGDAQSAVAAGASHLGLNFVPASPRFLGLEQAREIAEAAREAASALGRRVELVGVFADADPATIERADSALGFDAVQFHGAESPEAVRPWGERAWKALAIGPDGEFEEGARQRFPSVAAFLLDQPRGGSGSSWDYSRASGFARQGVLWLAGGLAPDNVEAAIRAARPFGVDASSRLELSPGRKDPSLVRHFVEAVRRAEED